MIDGQVKQEQTDWFKERKHFVGQRLQELLDSLVQQKHVKHAVMAVESGDKQFCWAGTVGYANPNGREMLSSTPFFIAGIDKLFITSVILRLYEWGLLDLNESISVCLPQALLGGLHRMGKVDYTDAITVRHLLNHTSGLADYLDDSPKGGRSLLQQFAEEGFMVRDIKEAVQIVREQLTPHFRPQSLRAKRQKVCYSNTNILLLIAIIEHVTGKPFHQVFKEMLFQPLNLKHTFFYDYIQPLEPSFEPATFWFGSKTLKPSSLLRSFRSICSTAEDTITILRAILSGKTFDVPATAALMQERWNRFSFLRRTTRLSAPGWPIEYGLGMMRFRLPLFFGHFYQMTEVVGHSGLTGSWLFYCPRLDCYFSGTVNQVTAGAIPYRVIPKLVKILNTSLSFN